MCTVQNSFINLYFLHVTNQIHLGLYNSQTSHLLIPYVRSGQVIRVQLNVIGVTSRNCYATIYLQRLGYNYIPGAATF
jgi:hypothetical protein